MTQDEINRREWRDPRNWKGGWLGIYHAPRDTRTIVPKRNPAFGWTFNTGRRAGMVLTVGILGLAAAGLALGVGGR